jgi:hypothetical protein
MAVSKIKLSDAALNYAAITGAAVGKNKKTDQQDNDTSTIGMLKRELERTKSNATMSSIQSKLRTGKRLTPTELAYLKANSPDLYDKAMRIEQERADYKKELRRCRSKDDVEKLRRRRVETFAAEAAAIAKNPNIPQEKKQEYIDFISMRAAAAEEEHTEYRKSAEYRMLPDKSKDRDSDDEQKGRYK